ncbi:protein LNK1 [Rhodamnia argentea]|uniref:Protein LNK1 n=1 Tax=Rhodamnia argentea TaxID=178133 RepID=A0A8B8QSY4_9MYRT|nr:protein LNK1 [Rhodamnia argentea]
MYELQDNVWDEFGENDDHIVPHPADEAEDQCLVQNDSRKKLRLQLTGVTSNADGGTNSVVLGKEESNSETLIKKEKMLEKDAWSHTPDGMFPASCDNLSSKEVRSMASDDSRMSSHCFKSNADGVFCADGHVIDERCAAVDNSMYSYSLNHISPTENNLNFFNHEDKESNDLYYGWPDIGNFEDVDKIFRSCDSTFGVGSLSNDDDLGWFSTSEAIEGSEDAIKSGLEFSCSDSKIVNRASETCGNSLPHGNFLSHDDPRKKSATLCDNMSMQVNGSGETAALGHISSMNGSGAQSESKEDSMSEKEMNKHKKQSNLQHRSELKRKDRYLENGGSFRHHSILDQFPHVEVPFSDSSNQMHNEYLHSGYFHHVNQISGCSTLSSVKSDDQLSPTPKESSYSSNQVSLATNFNPADVTSPSASICDPDVVLKCLHPSENGIESRSNGEVNLRVPADMDSSLMQESSCMSSALDEMSLEAASFRQLQRVMEQLDIKTKLCIRDSLYRLARSAEQRHNGVIPVIDSKNDGAHSGVMTAEETNKCSGFLDMETDTNPIDRSVAHLLFHRPSDLSVLPGSDASSPKSIVMIHRSVASPPVKNERDAGQEEAVAEAEKAS